MLSLMGVAHEDPVQNWKNEFYLLKMFQIYLYICDIMSSENSVNCYIKVNTWKLESVFKILMNTHSIILNNACTHAGATQEKKKTA